MSPQTQGLLVGGLIPAVLFAVSGVLQKVSTQQGISVGMSLVCAGLAIVICGCLMTVLLGDRSMTPRGGLGMFAMGVAWSIGVGAVVYALNRFQVPISKLVPIYNMNTLIAVVISLLLFAEYAELNFWKLLLGAVLTVVGGLLAATA